jgi:hypothetical protein
VLAVQIDLEKLPEYVVPIHKLIEKRDVVLLYPVRGTIE